MRVGGLGLGPSLLLSKVGHHLGGDLSGCEILAAKQAYELS